eukprot:gnl/TRDRNA2_/TRDRNA2_203913_c0_seq1.p1 gnl/TRDRNA2_/TRDRNA2_203913_c0~~gnl/TRDRNA2_/TRDRNA2_203913_c0_seq1.p1  ORF type:complete len:229 (-),score=28.74 gnl/TRDRNA2_/TRDRNA2_203913_c0_seq1:117-767(-)
MALVQIIRFLCISFTRKTSEPMSIQAQTHLFVYVVSQSSASMFFAQAFSNIAVQILMAGSCTFLDNSHGIVECWKLVERWVKYYIPIVVLLCMLYVFFSLDYFYGDDFDLVYELLCVVCFLLGVYAYVVMSKLSGASLVFHVLKLLLKAAMAFSCQMLFTATGVMIRVAAGEQKTGWWDPVINDYQARTWYSIVVCAVKRNSGSWDMVLDLVQRWT